MNVPNFRYIKFFVPTKVLLHMFKELSQQFPKIIEFLVVAGLSICEEMHIMQSHLHTKIRVADVSLNQRRFTFLRRKLCFKIISTIWNR